MKILFLPQTSEIGPASRYRVYQYLDYLREQGIDCNISPAIPSRYFSKVYTTDNTLKKILYLGPVFLKRLRDLTRIKDYDIIFLQREILPQAYPVFEKAIAFFKKNLIFDFDDAVFLVPPQRDDILYKFRYKNNIPEILKISRHIIAGNNYLKEYALRFNQNVTVIPTSIDTQRYTIKKYTNSKEDKIIIGWIGSHNTIFYLDLLKDVFIALAKKYKIKLNIIGVNNYKIKGVEITTKKWDLNTEVQDLRGFDIGVAPLTKDEWALGKCGCKLLQYMGVGIPSVSSRVGVNKEIVQDGINGFLADAREEWIKKLSLLIEDKNLRRKMGMEGRVTVEKNFSIRANAPKLKAVLDRVYKELL